MSLAPDHLNPLPTFPIIINFTYLHFLQINFLLSKHNISEDLSFTRILEILVKSLDCDALNAIEGYHLESVFSGAVIRFDQLKPGHVDLIHVGLEGKRAELPFFGQAELH